MIAECYTVNLYGRYGEGTVFTLTPQGSAYAENVAFTFSGYGAGGIFPNSGLIADSTGALYGTTEAGGNVQCNCGTLFKLTHSGSVWTETFVYGFQGNEGNGDGAYPSSASLVADATGALYGTTFTAASVPAAMAAGRYSDGALRIDLR